MLTFKEAQKGNSRPISSEKYIHKKGSIYCSNLLWASGEWNNTRALVVSDEVSIMSSIKAMLKSLLSQELFSKHKCDSQSSPQSSTGRHRRSPPHVQSVIRQAKSAESVDFMWVSRRERSTNEKIPHRWKNGQTKFLLCALPNYTSPKWLLEDLGCTKCSLLKFAG